MNKPNILIFVTLTKFGYKVNWLEVKDEGISILTYLYSYLATSNYSLGTTISTLIVLPFNTVEVPFVPAKVRVPETLKSFPNEYVCEEPPKITLFQATPLVLNVVDRFEFNVLELVVVSTNPEVYVKVPVL